MKYSDIIADIFELIRVRFDDYSKADLVYVVLDTLDDLDAESSRQVNRRPMCMHHRQKHRLYNLVLMVWPSVLKQVRRYIVPAILY